MGRKGVSKRKERKSKNSPVSNPGANSTVSSLMHATESSAPQSSGSGETAFNGKGAKKKSSDNRQNSRKR